MLSIYNNTNQFTKTLNFYLVKSKTITINNNFKHNFINENYTEENNVFLKKLFKQYLFFNKYLKKFKQFKKKHLKGNNKYSNKFKYKKIYFLNIKKNNKKIYFFHIINFLYVFNTYKKLFLSGINKSNSINMYLFNLNSFLKKTIIIQKNINIVKNDLINKNINNIIYYLLITNNVFFFKKKTLNIKYILHNYIYGVLYKNKNYLHRLSVLMNLKKHIYLLKNYFLGTIYKKYNNYKKNLIKNNYLNNSYKKIILYKIPNFTYGIKFFNLQLININLNVFIKKTRKNLRFIILNNNHKIINSFSLGMLNFKKKDKKLKKTKEQYYNLFSNTIFKIINKNKKNINFNNINFYFLKIGKFSKNILNNVYFKYLKKRINIKKKKKKILLNLKYFFSKRFKKLKYIKKKKIKFSRRIK